MIRRWWLSIAPLLLVSSCTPLGLWVYEDPVVTVSRVTIELKESRQTRRAPVVVALAVDNRNTYALSAERVELALRLDGVSIGRLDQHSAVPVAMATVSTVAMVLPLQQQGKGENLTALGSGTHTFAVKGRATFRTPFGKREVRFEQEGAMKFGERSGS
jgi:LEA14-like dessication related protein